MLIDRGTEVIDLLLDETGIGYNEDYFQHIFGIEFCEAIETVEHNKYDIMTALTG